jgi:NAD(P)-dependent dehydrogenase (short-subunit alcohol dehydrogenase family)
MWSMVLFVFEWATQAPSLVDMSVPMTGKHVIITGGCAGIGEELATIMVAAGASVVLGCRDAIKADAAVERIRTASARSANGAGQGGEIEQMRLDLASFKSVRRFASEYAEKYDTLDVLVNNAGLGFRV